MARISGVDLPNKRIEIALTYIYGIGRTSAVKVVEAAGIDRNKRADDLEDNEVNSIRQILERDYLIEGDLRQRVSSSIKRLTEIGCYRGIRHRKGLPLRGQRTRTNGRTRKGRGRAIAGKKIVKK